LNKISTIGSFESKTVVIHNFLNHSTFMKTSILILVSTLACGLASHAKDAVKTTAESKLSAAANNGDDSTAELIAKAEKGDAEARYQLAVKYLIGEGTAMDGKEALKWLKLAAEQGHPRAQYSLGIRYVEGKIVSQDHVEAAKWYRKSANQGLAPAQYALGVRYAEGTGVPRDYVEAYKWFTIAHAGGRAQAELNMQTLVSMEKLTPEQVEEAKIRASEFSPKPSINLEK
jgi:TPR repeat protein